MAVIHLRRADILIHSGDTEPLANPDEMARAVLAYDPAPICADMGGDSLAEHFRPSGCNRNCVQGRMCDCVADISFAQDREPQPKPETSNSVLWACVAAALLGLAGAAVQFLQAGSVPIIDKPAPASAPVAKVTT